MGLLQTKGSVAHYSGVGEHRGFGPEFGRRSSGWALVKSDFGIEVAPVPRPD